MVPEVYKLEGGSSLLNDNKSCKITRVGTIRFVYMIKLRELLRKLGLHLRTYSLLSLRIRDMHLKEKEKS